jgi:hypothetical protein
MRNEQQVRLVPVGLQDAGEICDAERFLDSVVLDEEYLHIRSWENARQNFSKNNTPISTFFENYVAAGVHGVSNLA